MTKKKNDQQNFDTLELEKIYLRAEETITTKLKNPKINYFQQRQKKAILQQIKRELARLQKPTKRFLERWVLDEFLFSYQLVERVVTGKQNSKNDFLPIVDKRAVNSLIRTAMDEVKNTLSQSYFNLEVQLNNLTNEMRREVLRETGSAIITGESRQKLSMRIKDYLERKGLTGFTYQTKPSKKNPQGKVINQKLGVYVKGLARSTLRQARLDGVVQRSTEYDIDLLKFSSHGDPSPMCQPYQGKIVSISGKNKKYTSLKTAQSWMDGMGMMNHKWCRHSASPYIESKVGFDDIEG